MEITVAKYAGFCFGVKRAVDTVYQLLQEKSKNTTLYTVGKLIHNPLFIEELRQKGVEIVEANQLQEIYRHSSESHPAIVVIRTHGIPKVHSAELFRYAAQNPWFRVVDCTCPYVKKIHTIAAERTQDGVPFFIIGNADHPEVQGIQSYAKSDVFVFPDSNALEKWANEDFPKTWIQKTPVMAAQTTQNLIEWKKCQEIMQKVYTNALIFDTICSVTENRQTETDMLSKQMDMMLIVGGKDSSNTNKLYHISKKNQPLSFLIENISELPLQRVTAQMKVGITAGASTPNSIIEEVKKTMSELNHEQTFEEMLAESFKTLNTGETVKGTITSISANEIHVDLGTKVTGILPFSEITEDPSVKLDELYKVGDEIEAIAIKVSDVEGMATLSRKRIDSVTNWKTIVSAFETGAVLDGKIIDAIKGGLIILIQGVKVFVPASHSNLPKDADLRTLVGKVQKVKIIDINEQRHRAVASIRVVAREERKVKEDAFWTTIEKDKQYEGVVKSLTSYGAFVDLGGVDGMVHSSELSWRRIKHPSDVVSIGDTISVYVKDFDQETHRISLGYKTEEMDPWNIFNNKYKIGDTAEAKIVSMMPFGAFAEIIPGADGLIHISQIANKKISKPADVLEMGQIVTVKIIDIDMEHRKISLSIRALLEEAAKAEAEEAVVEENSEN